MKILKRYKMNNREIFKVYNSNYKTVYYILKIRNNYLLCDNMREAVSLLWNNTNKRVA